MNALSSSLNFSKIVQNLFVIASGLMMTFGEAKAQMLTNLYSFDRISDGYFLAYDRLILSDNVLYGTGFGGRFDQAGTVFKVNTDGTGYTNLHSFGGYGINHEQPTGLVLAGNTLYGTSYSGGTFDSGFVFRMKTDGSGYTNLFNFTGGNDGDGIQPRLVLSGNTLYGTKEFGGNSGGGTVFKINTDGSGFATLFKFTNNASGRAPNGGLVLSGNTLFGTTGDGGGGDSGTIFRVNTDGTGFSITHSFTYSEGANPQAGLILSGNTLYGTARYGGNLGFGAVFKINTDGSGFATFYSFSGGIDGATPEGEMILFGTSLYGTTFDGGSSGQGVIFALNINGGEPCSKLSQSCGSF